MAWFGGGIDAATARRILKNQQRIEQKLDALLAAFAIESEAPVLEASPLGLDVEQRAAIQAALDGGNKIRAIQLLRKATGLGLAESKQAVESGDY
jgi:ribosomal protein L7/L12